MMENLNVTVYVVRFLSLKNILKKLTGLKSAYHFIILRRCPEDQWFCSLKSVYHFMAVDISFLAVVQRINGSVNVHLTPGPDI